MQNPLPNNKTHHSSQNIFFKQSKRPTTTNRNSKKQKESTDVRQDKSVLTNTRARLPHPAVFTNGERSRAFLDTNTARLQNYTRGEKLIPSTFHLKPLSNF
jgi:hypothetical protein